MVAPFLTFPLVSLPVTVFQGPSQQLSKSRCWRLSLSRCSLCIAWPTVAVQTDLVSHAHTQLTHEETYNTRTKKGFDTMYWYSILFCSHTRWQSTQFCCGVLPLKPGVGQTIATHASSTARIIFFPVLMSIFPNLYFLSFFFSSPLLTF